MRKFLTFLKDKLDGKKKVKTVVELSNDSIYISPKGYGDCGTEDGHGCPVMLEIWEGELRVVVWSDINQEDPTHIISIAGAKEELRIKTDDEGNCIYCGQDCHHGEMCDEQQAGGFNE